MAFNASRDGSRVDRLVEEKFTNMLHGVEASKLESDRKVVALMREVRETKEKAAVAVNEEREKCAKAIAEAQASTTQANLERARLERELVALSTSARRVEEERDTLRNTLAQTAASLQRARAERDDANDECASLRLALDGNRDVQRLRDEAEQRGAAYLDAALDTQGRLKKAIKQKRRLSRSLQQANDTLNATQDLAMTVEELARERDREERELLTANLELDKTVADRDELRQSLGAERKDRQHLETDLRVLNERLTSAQRAQNIAEVAANTGMARIAKLEEELKTCERERAASESALNSLRAERDALRWQTQTERSGYEQEVRRLTETLASQRTTHADTLATARAESDRQRTEHQAAILAADKQVDDMRRQYTETRRKQMLTRDELERTRVSQPLLDRDYNDLESTISELRMKLEKTHEEAAGFRQLVGEMQVELTRAESERAQWEGRYEEARFQGDELRRMLNEETRSRRQADSLRMESQRSRVDLDSTRMNQSMYGGSALRSSLPLTPHDLGIAASTTAAQAQGKVESLTRELENNRRELSSLQMQLERAQSLLLAERGKVGDVTTQLKVCERDKEHLAGKLNEAKSNLAIAAADRTRLQEKVTSLATEINAMRTEADRARLNHSTSSSTIGTLTHQLNALQAAKAAAEASVADRALMLDKAASLERQVAALESQRRSSESRVRDAETAAATAAAECAKLRSDISDGKAAAAERERTIRDLKSAETSALEQHRRLERELATVRHSLEECLQQFNERELSFMTLEANLTRVTDERAVLHARYESVQRQLEAANKELSTMTQDCARLSAALEDERRNRVVPVPARAAPATETKTEGDWHTLHGKMAAEQIKTEYLQKSLDKAEAELTEANSQNKTMASQLRELADLREQLHTTSQARLRLQAEADSLRSQVNAFEGARAGMLRDHARVPELEAELAVLNQSVFALQQENLKHVKSLNAAIDRAAAADNESARLARELSTAQTTVVSLQADKQSLTLRLETSAVSLDNAHNTLQERLSELGFAKAKAAEMEMRASSTENERKRLESQIDQTSFAASTRAQSLSEAELRTRALGDQLEVARREVMHLQEQLTSVTADRDRLTREVAALQSSNKEIQRLLDETTASLTETLAQLDAATDMKQIQDQDTARVLEDNENLSQRIQDLAVVVERQKTEVDAMRTSSLHEVSVAQARVKEILRQKDQETNELRTSFETERASLKRSIVGRTEEVADEQRKYTPIINDLKNRVESATVESQRSSVRARELEAVANTAKQEMERLLHLNERDATLHARKVDALSAAEREAQAALANSTRRMQQVSGERDQLALDVTRLQMQCSDLQRSVLEQQAIASQSAALVHDYEQQLRHQDALLASLQPAMNNATV